MQRRQAANELRKLKRVGDSTPTQAAAYDGPLRNPGEMAEGDCSDRVPLNFYSWANSKLCNGFTCFPDDTTTPTNDPMCLDPNGLEWLHALMEKKEPPKMVGFGYMLQGESAASNVDPFAQPPADMKDLSKWHEAGPHIMIFNPAAGGLTGYVKPGENADVTQPWVMWAGSPYEHLMIPIEWDCACSLD